MFAHSAKWGRKFSYPLDWLVANTRLYGTGCPLAQKALAQEAFDPDTPLSLYDLFVLLSLFSVFFAPTNLK